MPMMQVVVQAPTPPNVPFDPNFALGAVVPLLGVVALALAAAFIFRWFFRSPIGEAIAEGIRERRGRRWRGPWSAEAEPGRMAGLEQEVTRLRGEISELAERLDFAERMLAERREPKLRAGQ
jgi:hypothetical protein